MPIPVTLIDENTAGGRFPAISLDFLEEHVTAREILRRRIYEEVTEYNAQKTITFQGLVQPEHQESNPRRGTRSAASKIDWEQQYARATEAFTRMGFIMLVDDRQIDGLDDIVHLRLDKPTEVIFLKLVPLVGG